MLSYLEVNNGFIELSSKKNAEIAPEWLQLPNKVSLKYLCQGILEVKPAQLAKKSVVISCGVHGNETAPIEIVSGLISRIVTGSIEPKVNLLFILGNPESMLISQRFVEINMNRLFNKAHQNYELNEKTRYEIERAIVLENAVSDFYERYNTTSKQHFDLHTAIKPSFHKTFAIRPYNNMPMERESKKLLASMGIEAVLQHNKPSNTFSAFSVETFDAEAYTLELGKVKPFGENDMQDFCKAIECLDNLVQDKAIGGASSTDIIEYKVVAEVIKQSENFKFNVAEDVPNFTAFPQGYLIAEDDNYNYRVAYFEEAVVFPNPNVPIGQRVAVMVTRISED
ncbi:succinylglutamate desuccinylase [Aliikangiella sp. G2MR2-5]|uniref:succinylglutamate desuccinylase n=1 Tax=Aliikangiella sp. G2MR2-5 TaxID=2788943 RepID=UPI0018AB56A1